MRAVTLWAIALCAAQSAAAEDSPVAGFFRYFAPGDGVGGASDQLACAFGFFQQDASGNGHDYLFDHEAYARTGKISYRIGTAFTCSFEAADQTEICQITSPLAELNSGAVHYLYYDITPDTVGFDIFGSPEELRAAVAAQKPGEVPADLNTFVRCDGWTEAALAPFIDKTPVGPSDQALLKGLENPFTGAEADANLQLAKQIRKAVLGQ